MNTPTTHKEYYALLHAGRASMLAVYFSEEERQAAIARHEAKHDSRAAPITRAEAKRAAASAFGSPDYVAVPDPIRSMLGVPYQPAS